MASRQLHTPEVRAAVIAALLEGQSVSQIAKAYKLPKGTVSAWKTRKAGRVAGVAGDATQKDGGDVGDQLLALVRANLQGLIAGAAVLRDEKWLRAQGAAELGTILGITHDKTMRMLEAMGETRRR